VDRVVVLGAKQGELVIVMLPSQGARAEMVHVDEAEVAAARDAAAVVVAQGDALAGGLGQRPELEAAVRRDRAHKPAGPLRAEKLGDGLGDCAHVGIVPTWSACSADSAGSADSADSADSAGSATPSSMQVNPTISASQAARSPTEGGTSIASGPD